LDTAWVLIPGKDSELTLYHWVHTGSGAHPTSKLVEFLPWLKNLT